MRGTTLLNLLTQYRAECGMSFNVAHNINDRSRQVQHIQRTQEWLWEDFNWPETKVKRPISVQAGQRFYEPPADMHLDRVVKVEMWFGGRYVELTPGIDSAQYSIANPDLDQRSWPPQKWAVSEDHQIEIWPLPSQDADADTLDGRLMVTGYRNLRPLVADNDVADLDDRLVILFCAAEYLAGTGGKSASLKLDQANKRYLKLRGMQQKRRITKMFGGQVERAPKSTGIVAVHTGTPLDPDHAFLTGQSTEGYAFLVGKITDGGEE